MAGTTLDVEQAFKRYDRRRQLYHPPAALERRAFNAGWAALEPPLEAALALLRCWLLQHGSTSEVGAQTQRLLQGLQ